MLENPDKLPEMVKRSGAHSTDLEHEESAEHLCAKCENYAAQWKSVADSMWSDTSDPEYNNRQRADRGMAETDMSKFERLGTGRKVG